MSAFAEVVPLAGLPMNLTYAIPSSLHSTLKAGMLVKINLQNRNILGVVANPNVETTLPHSKIKFINNILYDHPVITKDLLCLAAWIQQYYAATADSVYETMIPAAVRRGLSEKKVKIYKIIKSIGEDELEIIRSKAPKQFAAYNFIKERAKTVERSELLQALGPIESAIRTLLKKGVLEESFESKIRVAYDDEFGGEEIINSSKIALTEEQNSAVQEISVSLSKEKFQVHVLHGVTGSGKTEVYLQAIKQVLKNNGQVIFIVPEVALTPQTVGRIRGRLINQGINTVVWHSQLSEGERFDAWMSISRGEVQVVVGARSAIFAPMPNLKLVVVDEEHEPSFKQGETPRYHGRDVAVYRAMLCKCVCILGSATPSLETLYNINCKKYKVNRLTKRVDYKELPTVHVVDMRGEVLREKGATMLSRTLVEKLKARFEAKEQSILFINRRGYSSRMICPDCSYIAECNHCSVSLTYHRNDETLRCHVCGHTRKAMTFCPSCRSNKISWRGFGTQKVEDVVAQVLPKANIVRMDTDTMNRKNRFREILTEFRRGKIDVLVGTQMIAKGLDFPNVTLVGLIDADISLHLPDFRAHERTFQLVVQVAGRAGRGDKAGEVIIQTFVPHSAPIQFAKRSDFKGFLESELEQRKEFNYPPYRHIIRHIFRGTNKNLVSAIAEKWALAFEKHFEGKLEVRGPAPAPLEKIKDNYRYHLWFFTKNISSILPEIVKFRQNFKMPKEVIDVFDVDPVDMI